MQCNPGFILKWLVVCCAVFFCGRYTQAQLKTAGVDSMALAFVTPPLEARPKALWPWVNGNVSLSQITLEMEEAKRKGMGGFDIWDVGVLVNQGHQVPAGPPFLGRLSLEAIRHAVQEGDRLQLEMGLITSSSWNAGGTWVKPEHGAMGMFVRDTVVIGPQTFSAALSFPSLPPFYQGSRPNIMYKDSASGLPLFYRDIAIVAHPLAPDSFISKRSDIVRIPLGHGEPMLINWTVPAGKWRIARYVCAPTGQPLMVPSPNSNGLMLDHFSAEAQEANMNHVIGSLKSYLGDLHDRSLKYLYEDSYEVNSAVWTPALPQAFRDFAGYQIEGWLPLLEGFRLKDQRIHQGFMFDFSKLLSELIIRNHYALGRTISAKHGLGFYAEAGGPGKPIHNVPFEDLKALGSLTVPRGEFWVLGDDWKKLQVIKGIASASHIYQQKFVEAEAFTSVWLWQEGPGALKPLADRAMCEGLNRFVYHTFPHTPPESGTPGWIYNFGTLINTTNGWWEKSEGFHTYLARCSYLLQQGRFVGDIAFYYGDEAPNFVSPKQSPADLGSGYDYDVINSDVILNRLIVKDGRFVLPDGQSYALLVMPNDRRANPDVLRKLLNLVRQGGTIVGARPVQAYGLGSYTEKDKEVNALAQQIWGAVDSVRQRKRDLGAGKVFWGEPLHKILQGMGIGPDFAYSGSSKDTLDYIHRTTDSAEIYFVRNVRKEPWTGTLRLRVTGSSVSCWQPETGMRTSLDAALDSKGNSLISFSLPGEGACFIVFDKSARKRLLPAQRNNDQRGEIVLTTLGPASLQRTKTLELGNNWQIDFEAKYGSPPKRIMSGAVGSLPMKSDTLLQFFSGKMIYSRMFTLTGDGLQTGRRFILFPGEMREIGELYINGNRIGYHWHASQYHDITEHLRNGDNTILMEVVNSINNALVGDGRRPEAYRTMRSNVTKLPNAWMTPFADAPLIPAGWLGPVKLEEATLIK